MSASEILTGTLITLIGIVGLIMLPSVWGGYFTRKQTQFRGQLRSHGELTYIWWPFGAATRRGLMRSFVPTIFAAWGIVIGYWVAELGGGAVGHLSGAGRLVVGLTVAWFTLGFVLLLTVMFFNWPKFIVPPGQRNEPGAVGEWRSSRRGKYPG
jgi:hypothetical protein